MEQNGKKMVVWVKDPKIVWAKAEMVDGESSTMARKLCDGGELVGVMDEYLLYDEADEKPVDDMTSLRHIHEASILNTLNIRYGQDLPYTFISNVLVSVNPISETKADKDVSQALGTKQVLNTPHPYAIAECAYEQLEREKKSQCIIISGESGSGKSESCKRVIRHLVSRSGKTCSVDKQLLAASPILESFGNAQTMSNGNSSRFGKFVNLYFSNVMEFKFASIQSYLLERSRVTRHDSGERSFHVFYQLLAGADRIMKEELFLDHVDEAIFTQVRRAQDGQKFSELVESMQVFGMDDDLRGEVFKVVAAILHLSNLKFTTEDSQEGPVAVLESQTGLQHCASLLGIDDSSLLQFLCEKTMTLRGETMVSRRSMEAAQQSRDALAKSVYQSLFDWLMRKVNHGLGDQPKSLGSRASRVVSQELSFIGILDIFGFERFEKNSFEQLLINFANEALQTTFNKHIFQGEIRVYDKEGLDLQGITQPKTTCLDCLTLFRGERYGSGLLSSIDAISVGPEPNDTKLIRYLHRTYKENGSFLSPHPRLADSIFIVQHYAGPVSYHIHGFVEKNMDSLPNKAEDLFIGSTLGLVQELMKPTPTKKGTAQKKSNKSIALKFEQQMQCLIAILNETTSYFIRCVKPNAHLCPKTGFDAQCVARQLECLSIPQTAQLLRAGLPGRVDYKELFERAGLDSDYVILPHFHRHVARFILTLNGFTSAQFKLGNTKAFFANGVLPQVDQILEKKEHPITCEDVEMVCAVYATKRILLHVGAVRRMTIFIQRRRAQRLKAAIFIQTRYRRFKASRNYQLLRRAAVLLQQEWRQSQTCTKAATTLQAQVRKYLAQQKYYKYVHAIRVVQQKWLEKGDFFAYSSEEEEERRSENEQDEDEDPVDIDSILKNRAQPDRDDEDEEGELDEGESVDSSCSELALIMKTSEILLYNDSPDEIAMDDIMDGLINDDDEVGFSATAHESKAQDDDEEEAKDDKRRASRRGEKTGENEDWDDEGYSADYDGEEDGDEAEFEEKQRRKLLKQQQQQHSSMAYVDAPEPTEMKRKTSGFFHRRLQYLYSRKVNNSDGELTSILLKFSSNDDEDITEETKHGEEGASGAHIRTPSITQIIKEYRESLHEQHGGASATAANNKRLFKFPGIFKIKNREERTILKKLRTGIKKKHYRMLIENLVRARQLDMRAPEIATAETMIIRIMSIHAQQLLREAILCGDLHSLEQAIENADKFGMEDSQGLLQQAREMQQNILTKQQRQGSTTSASSSASSQIQVGPETAKSSSFKTAMTA